MFNTLPELLKALPIGSRIRTNKTKERDEFVTGKFNVDGYLVDKDCHWYPAHKMPNGNWEIYDGE